MIKVALTRRLCVFCALIIGLVATLVYAAEEMPAPPPRAGEANVVEVRIDGATTHVNKLPRLNTREQQSFDPKTVEDDVRALDRTGKFIDIRPKYQRTAAGIVVVFEVEERPILREVKYVGNVAMRQSLLLKKGELKPGDSVDPQAIEDARRSVERYYHEKGFSKASLLTVEGNKPGDRKAVFLVNEGPKQRVWKTQFVGNTIADDARLKTQIQSKPGILWFFGGEVDMQKIDDDIEKLTTYYRSLGFFQAKISRDLEYDEDQDWLTVTFMINEGPRYKVRKVSIVGNTKFSTAEIEELLELKGGEYFDQGKLNLDLNSMRDIYGGRGYIFSDVQADTRFLEEAGDVDLVYDIAEGNQYRVGDINVTIQGDAPHTRKTVVLNRFGIRPGDIADTRELRDTERRIKQSQVFVNDPSKGQVPKVAIIPPSGEDGEDPSDVAQRERKRRAERDAAGSEQARSGSAFRGQSPDTAPRFQPQYQPQYQPQQTVAPRLVPGSQRPQSADPVWTPSWK
ncbi:MAG: POTRA domain-containing protein [Planctomycetota bacterium]|nr:POTRA domain-containing protein [Planctomycetota bacterium]